MAEQYRFVITADDSQVTNSFNEMANSGQRAADTISNSFKAATAIMIAGFSIGKFKEGFEIFKEFDDQSKAIKAFANASVEQMDLVNAKAQELAPLFGKLPAEVLAGMAAAKQGGMELNDVLQTTDEIMQLSAGVNIDMATSADKLTDIINMFGLSMKDAGDATNVTIAAISNGALVADDYFEAMKKAGPVLSSYGLSHRQVSAEIMALAEGGIKGSIAATGLNNAYARLLKPTGDAVEILKKYNFTAVDSVGKTKMLADMVDELAEKGLTDKEKLEIFGMYAGPTLSSLLARGGDSIRKYDELLANVDGTGQRVAETMQSGVGGASRRAYADLQNGIIKAFYDLEPAITGVLSLMQYFDEAVDIVVGTTKTAAAGVTVLAGAAAKLGSVFEAITDAVGVTDDATNFLGEGAEQSLGAANELLQQAAMSFSFLSDSSVSAAQVTNSSMAKVEDRLKNINKNLGLNVQNWEELEEVVAEGTITWEEVSAASSRAVDTTQRDLANLNAATEDADRKNKIYADGVIELFKATGEGSSEYYAIQEERIREDVEKYIAAGMDKVKAEELVQARIGKLQEEAAKKGGGDSFAKVTGFVDFEEKARDIEGYVDVWKESGRSIEEINKAVYSKITSIMGEALNAGETETVERLDTIRSAYDGFSGSVSKSVSETNEKIKEAFSDDIIDKQAIEEQTQYYIDMGMKRVDAERKATEEIKGLNIDASESMKEAMSSFESITGFVDFEEKGREIEGYVDTWKDAGISIEDINRGVYERITSLIGSAIESGNSEAVKSLDSMRSKYSSFSGEVSDSAKKINESLSGTFNSDVDLTVNVDADTSEAESKIDSLDGKSVSMSLSVDTSSIAALEKAIEELNNAPTLDPFGKTRENYEEDLAKLNKLSSMYKSAINEINSSGFSGEYEDTLNKYQDALDKINGATMEESAEEIEIARELSKMKKDIWDKEVDARKDAYKEQLDAQKDALDEEKEALEEQLDAAEEALDYAKEFQKAYYQQQIDDAKEYYKQLEEERDEAEEHYEELAEAEYEAALNLLEKKKKLWEDELNSAETHLNDLKQIYEESGAGADQYYEAEADALARRAQEMKDNGTDISLIEQWLTDELGDLRNKAAQDGVNSLGDYTDAIERSYKQTGEFSKQTAKANSEIDELNERIAALKEGGADAFFNQAAFEAQGFDEKLAAANDNIERLQEGLDEVSGKNFDFAGESADSLALKVANAESNVNSLKSSIDSVADSIERINKIDVEKKFESSYSDSTGYSASSSSEQSFWREGLGEVRGTWNRSFDGGGYTGNTPRIGGVDGKGGFPAILHGDEYVIDLTKGGKSGTIGEKDSSVYVENIYITSSQKVDGNMIKEELRRLQYRG